MFEVSRKTMQRSLIGGSPTRPKIRNVTFIGLICKWTLVREVCLGFVLRPYDFLGLGWTLDSCQVAIYQESICWFDVSQVQLIVLFFERVLIHTSRSCSESTCSRCWMQASFFFSSLSPNFYATDHHPTLADDISGTHPPIFPIHQGWKMLFGPTTSFSAVQVCFVSGCRFPGEPVISSAREGVELMDLDGFPVVMFFPRVSLEQKKTWDSLIDNKHKIYCWCLIYDSYTVA